MEISKIAKAFDHQRYSLHHMYGNILIKIDSCFRSIEQHFQCFEFETVVSKTLNQPSLITVESSIFPESLDGGTYRIRNRPSIWGFNFDTKNSMRKIYLRNHIRYQANILMAKFPTLFSRNALARIRPWPTALPTGPRGPSGNHIRTGNAQRNQTQILHFCKATAKPNF